METQQDVTIRRKLVNVYTPPAQPGFLGPDHTARAVIHTSFSESDPFILLMDDVLDKKGGEPVGGPHPHAGFETVTLILEGELGDDDHRMKAGDFQMMTAGSGIVHTETIDRKTRMRLLQLWLNLPKKDRWTAPRVQDLTVETVPRVSESGLEIRLYSGSFAGITSPVQNHVPVIIADIQLQPGVSTTQQLPASFNTFLYVVGGSVGIGKEGKLLKENQVGWLDKFSGDALSDLQLTAGETGGRVILYAGQPQHDPIVSYGPFIGDTESDIKGLYQVFRQGKMGHVSVLPENQKFRY
ncbi:pirin family protein [Larkinella humicola]|uniref:Pirin family protein n=1 Tax=Larkinella humicola TaxID=2607654 RepID=A0A5N1JM09_9BACT|nr:pirin-like C-terminal cupin domain-containing protein [Larkinella humicola]KAA9355023.1 pirin family protein [Larkinella humicola]